MSSMNIKRGLVRHASRAWAWLALGAVYLPGLGGCASSSMLQPPATAVAPSPANAGSGDVPYSLTLEPFTVPGFPGIHSGAHAVYQGKLILVAGRRNGLHGFPRE